MTQEQFAEDARSTALRILTGLGIDPDGPTPTGGSYTMLRYLSQRLYRSVPTELYEYGGVEAIMFEVSTSPYGLRSIEHFRRSSTGRSFWIGSEVWVHDRDDRNHPIYARGVLTVLDGMQVRVIDGWPVTNSDGWVHVMVPNGREHGTKLHCLERIKGRDAKKSVGQMEAERFETSRRCREAEKAGETTLRKVQETFARVQFRMPIQRLLSMMREEGELRGMLFAQIAMDHDVEVTKVEPWMTLSPTALAIYQQYRTLTK